MHANSIHSVISSVHLLTCNVSSYRKTHCHTSLNTHMEYMQSDATLLLLPPAPWHYHQRTEWLHCHRLPSKGQYQLMAPHLNPCLHGYCFFHPLHDITIIGWSGCLVKRLPSDDKEQMIMMACMSHPITISLALVVTALHDLSHACHKWYMKLSKSSHHMHYHSQPPCLIQFMPTVHSATTSSNHDTLVTTPITSLNTHCLPFHSRTSHWSTGTLTSHNNHTGHHYGSFPPQHHIHNPALAAECITTLHNTLHIYHLSIV